MTSFIVITIIFLIINLIIGIREFKIKGKIRIFTALMIALFIFISLSILSFKDFIPLSFESILFLYIVFYLIGIDVIWELFKNKRK